ncbi:MAG TPA: adenosylcobinamide-GDP ribazoletransferase [Syntrophorhabdaceae bacterium]|nr:adenosylcobinamide-GDP ribazoletransferase [Syntrophorhabdaceae bacterium]
MKALTAAFQFLTIVPVRTKKVPSEKDLVGSSVFFPFVGATQGLVLAICCLVFLKIFSPEIVAALVIIVYAVVTGAFHLDGLSDTFDALAVRSSGNVGSDRVKRLAVMKDSTTGAIGSVSLILCLLFKYLLLRETLAADHALHKYLVLFLTPVFSKWIMVRAMYRVKSARDDGIGRIFLAHVRLRHFVLATVVFLVIGLTAGLIWSHTVLTSFGRGIGSFALFFCLAVTVTLSVGFLFKRLFTAKFGGLTGDNFGALHEITENAFLTVALLWK